MVRGFEAGGGVELGSLRVTEEFRLEMVPAAQTGREAPSLSASAECCCCDGERLSEVTDV